MQGTAKAANFATINIDENSSGKGAIRQNGSGDNLSTLSQSPPLVLESDQNHMLLTTQQHNQAVAGANLTIEPDII